MKVAIVYDGAAAGGANGASPGPVVAADVAGVMAAVDAVAASLAALGHTPTPVPITGPLDGLAARLPGVLAGADLLFNLAEGLDGRAEGEAEVARLLEATGIPVTGAAPDTLSLCRRKDGVNAVLEAAGVAVPAWALAMQGSMPAWSAYPAIVKPAGEDGSVGIGDDSVVEDAFELGFALARLSGEALVQRFVPGRELNVGFVGEVALPVAEIVFTAPHRVVSYAAKWESGSAADLATSPVCPAVIPPALEAEVLALARAAWSAVGGAGYGRVDLRTDEEGRPRVLEVNPNPDLTPGAGLARMAGVAGWSYTELVGRIVAEARS
jgi:D-alanine-D-alanine ligase